MKYRIAIQAQGAVTGLVTPDRRFAEMVLDRLVGRPGVEWVSFEASASGVFTPLEEGTAVALTQGEVEQRWREAGQLDLIEELTK